MKQAALKTRAWTLAGAALVCLVWSCAPEARPQVLLFVDTDLPVYAPLNTGANSGLTGNEHSVDAAVDTLWIELPVEEGQPPEIREVALADASSLPVSFGVKSDQKTVTLRLQLFRRWRSFPDHRTEPHWATSVDRRVSLTMPSDTIDRLLVRLSGDCFGVQSTSSDRTCVSAQQTDTTSNSGLIALAEDEEPASATGTWPGSLRTPCEGTAPEGQTCVPGGFAFLGDWSLDGLSTKPVDEQYLKAAPPKAVVVDSFFMDTTEFTVGRLWKVIEEAGADWQGGEPSSAEPGNEHCTWPDGGAPPSDAVSLLPVNCVSAALAAHACEQVGGRLPLEAEWELAARGGQSATYPWGFEKEYQCCVASMNRTDSALCCSSEDPYGAEHPCSGPYGGLEPVGSHSSDNGFDCDHYDETPEGVLDLAGSVSELTRSLPVEYDAECWGLSPSSGAECASEAEEIQGSSDARFIARGSSVDRELEMAEGALRQPFFIHPRFGFRCVYPGSGAP